MISMLVFVACTDKSMVGEPTVDDNEDNTHLIGDSNVFLDDPVAEIDVSTSIGDDSAEEDSGVSDLGNVKGILLNQNEGDLEVRHFGVELDCNWSFSDINIQYFDASNVSPPYVGGLNADYGSVGNCVVNLEYIISLSAISNDFNPGLHVFFSNNEQIIIDLVEF